MTSPERHAATVRKGILPPHAASNRFEHQAAHAALDELVALAGRADELGEELAHLKSEYHFDMDRGDHLVYAREWDAFNQWQRGDLSFERRALAAEARADELQRERDEAIEAGQTMVEFTKKAERERDEARREADQLRAALRDTDEAFQWIAVRHPRVMHELPTPLYRGLRRAALAGVQADNKDSSR